MDGQSYLKFENKVGTRDNWKVVDPEMVEKRRPKVVDSKGNPLPHDLIIGNGSEVKVKFSIPKENPPGGKGFPHLPRIDVVQVLKLVTYENTGTGKTAYGLGVEEGGFVLGEETNVTRIDAPTKANTVEPEDDSDPFARLERTEDLKPSAGVAKKKRAA